MRLLVTLPLLLAACTVGPDYAGPPRTGLEAQRRFVRADPAAAIASPARADWWRALSDAGLDRLEAAAIAANPDLDAARARLREARAELGEQRANLLPTTEASVVYLHSHGGTGLLGGVLGGGEPGLPAAASDDFDLYDVGFDASWEADLFGGQRRAVQSARAQSRMREADLADAQVSLTADVANAYVALRDAQHRLALTQRSVDLQQQMLDLTRRRALGGTASELDVARLQTQVDDTTSGLMPLRADIAEQLDRLAVLSGRAPGTLDGALATAPDAGYAGVVPLPPPSVPVGDPASLLRRRPDIRAAERRVAAANAVIGERIADYFPKLSFVGNVGFASAEGGSLLNGANFFGIVAPSLQWRPFDFGRTHARVVNAKAGLAEAEADYRSTVLKAMDDAETALARYAIERDDVRVLQREQESAERAAALTRLRLAGGTASLIDTLDTERQRLAAEQALAVAQGTLTTDYVAIQKSLGLGWDARG